MIDPSFAHYRVLTKLGEGGMGEVYRARDTRLNRDVAIKVLPHAFAAHAERLARFTREAQTLASLNHPNIAHIHGLEESGGVRALVMELVEGDDLSTLIARGPVPLADALPIARQVAEALEAAHELGIVHRDLKPANIKIRPDGTMKVLDFGLAKAMDPAGASSADALNSPTLTALGTKMGVILGTAAYMAPEQAKGKAIDRRADIWAFGVVLYEMLTGTRLFDGETVSDVLAAVLTREPDWTALPARTPAAVRRLLARCPRLSPDGRWIVYSSDESGHEEIYAQAFPGLGHRVQISVEGGSEPIWHPRGGEIVYRAALSRHFMSVSVEAKETLVLSPPRELISDAGMERGGADHTEFDVASDGRLLAVEEPPADYRVDMHVILGWAQAAGLLP